MVVQSISTPLPDAHSPDIHLSHPTGEECLKIWELSSLAWRDALTLPLYLEESAFLTTVPLARDGGMTIWILVDKNLLPNHRPILCACESFRKRSYISDSQGGLTETIIHGVASVFTDPTYRGRGYASRLMRELAKSLRSWQADKTKCSGSVLYSDIGKDFYARSGWHPFPNNSHIKISPSTTPKQMRAKSLLAGDLDELCQEDEAMIRRKMTRRTEDGKLRLVLVPDLDHMLWHHSKEEFACEKLFGKYPQVKGAIAGEVGNRIWAIWTHRYYGDPDSIASGNTLYILRLVIENDVAANADAPEGKEITCNVEQQDIRVNHMKAILQTAQAEAAEWKLSSVHLWDPSSLAQQLIDQTGIQNSKISREDEGIASLLWYGEGSGKEDMLEWVANEKFAWC